MRYDLWAILFLSALACGTSLVAVLTVAGTKELLALASGLVTIGASTWAIIGLAESYGRVEIALYGGLLAFAAAAGGYALASTLLPSYAHKPPPLVPLAPFEPCDPRITVLLACPLEPEFYTPSSVATDLADLAEAGLPEPSVAITPFLFAAQKARYRAVGGRSPSIRAATELAMLVETLLDPEDFGPVELVTFFGADTLDQAVTRASKRGSGAVAVVTLSVGESYEIDHAKSRVDLLRPRDAGLKVAYTAPLWSSEAIAEDLANRIWTGRGDAKQTGVALVMHGQPESREKSHGVFDVHENAFSNRIRMLLTDRGLPDSNVRLCYLDWRDPDVTETIRHLAALGCTRVIVMPACIPFESVTTILDLQVAVRQARVEPHMTTMIMEPWGDEETLADVVAALVKEVAHDLETSR